MLAPGSDAVVDILSLMQANSNVESVGAKNDVFVSLCLLGASYSLGLYLALAVWKPILARKQANLNVRSKRGDIVEMCHDKF